MPTPPLSFSPRRLLAAVGLTALAAFWLSPANWLALALPFSSAPGVEYYLRAVMAAGVNMVWAGLLVWLLAQLPRVLFLGVFGVVAVWTVLFATFSAVHVAVYGQLLGAPSLLAVLDTSTREMAAFAASQGSWQRVMVLVATLLVWTALAVFIAQRLRQRLGGVRRPWVGLLLALWLGLSWAGWNRLSFANNNPFMFVYKVGGQALATRHYFQNIQPEQVQKTGARLHTPVSERQTHVLVVGESLTPSHMSLYGYPRPTTPLLAGVSDWERVFLKDVCSEQPMTQLSVAEIMTGIPADDIMLAANRPNLLSVLSEAGFKTFWITNQIGLGSEYALGDLWALYAHESRFLNRRDNSEGYDFDEVLLPALQTALSDPAPHKFIVLHMMGSHGKYAQRYPRDFKKWTDVADIPAHIPRRTAPGFDAQEFNDYDNSVLYTDHLLHRMLGLAARHGANSLVYLSDHGQNLGETSDLVGHSTTQGPRQGFEIPLLVFLSPAHVATLQPQWASLKRNTGQPFSSRHALYTLLDLYRVHAPLPGPRLTAEAYTPVARHCDALAPGALAQ